MLLEMRRLRKASEDGRGRYSGHGLRQSDVALHPAHQPVQPLQVLLRVSDVSSVCGPGSLSG